MGKETSFLSMAKRLNEEFKNSSKDKKKEILRDKMGIKDTSESFLETVERLSDEFESSTEEEKENILKIN